MQERQPSRTALGAAGYRAAHQVLDGAAVFADPFAHAILGDQAEAIIAALSADPSQAPARLFMAARSRFSEDAVAAAVTRGVRQAVVLGAGLDTFAMRNPHAELGLRVFEVDHPETQAWKLSRLAAAGLAIPTTLTFAPVDFEGDGLAAGLRDASFAPDQPAVFVWLGVAPYLGRPAIAATLGYIARIADAEVVFDYSEPLENYPPERRAEMTALGARAAAIGEPWLSHFDPGEMAELLRDQGFDILEDLTAGAITARYLGGEPPPGPGPHVVHARVRAAA
jgi:methyltransferase (TIGR00027 family)